MFITQRKRNIKLELKGNNDEHWERGELCKRRGRERKEKRIDHLGNPSAIDLRVWKATGIYGVVKSSVYKV
ncbi:hypothetical protein H5410_004467 [Solanum commersonii]|uniref:Uncharacterized protein n=1 Tax=Solanum commersonii TaxID=4109 RepID=A0A9J6B7S9_SOLCO|nr:hypothetical protein H5410_004467 [Solanum commersonii]